MTEGWSLTTVQRWPSRRLEWLVGRGLILVLVLSPLPLASNRLWSWSLFGVWIGALLLTWLCWVALQQSQSQRVFLPRSLSLAGVLFAGVCLFVALQASCLTPEAWHNPVWNMASEALGPISCTTISVHPTATWTALARLMTYGCLFWLFLQFCHWNGRFSRLTLYALAVMPALNAAYGLAMTLSGLDLIFWYEKWAYRDVVTGTFVNRNSFAVFLGMGAVVNLAVIADKLDRLGLNKGNWRDHLRDGLVVLTSHLPVFIAGFALCIAGVILTASRAGFAATLTGIIVLAATHILRQSTAWGRACLLAVVISAAVAGLTFAGGRNLEARLMDSDENAGIRMIVIAETFEAISHQPWLGVGYGAFEDAWLLYRPSTIKSRFRQTHSTYIENLFELGVPAAVSLFLAVGLVIVVCFRGIWRRRRDAIFPAVAVAASLIPITHSAIDFSLQIPAVNYYVAALLGLGMAQAYSSQDACGKEHKRYSRGGPQGN